MISIGQDVLPDIFLAGAPKSGTTLLFDLLADHPQIAPSSPKEPFYHIDSNNPHNQKNLINSCASYLDFFKGQDIRRFLLDGTSQTMYQEELPEKVKSITKKPRMVFVLREPASRIASSYRYTSNNLAAIQGLEFSAYADLLLKSKFDGIAEFCKDERAKFSMTHELEYSDYGKFLNVWQRTVGEENMCVVLFEDLISEPQSIVNGVCDFLDIPQVTVPKQLPKANESKAIKNVRLHYHLQKTYEFLGYQLPFRNYLKKIYNFFQQTKQDTEPLELSDLQSYFREKNRSLSSDFGLNLASWNQ